MIIKHIYAALLHVIFTYTLVYLIVLVFDHYDSLILLDNKLILLPLVVFIWLTSNIGLGYIQWKYWGDFSIWRKNQNRTIPLQCDVKDG